MHNDIMRTVMMYDRSSILGYNRRILAPFRCGNILGLNTAFTNDTGSILGTVAALGVGLGAQTISNSLNNQPNNMQNNRSSYDLQQNNFNNVSHSVGSPMNNVQPAYGANSNAASITNFNTSSMRQVQPAPVRYEPAPAPITANKPTPSLVNKVGKGSKTTICSVENAPKIKACLGWHTNCCDVDVSAFMLDMNSKALGEEWFVFYGQPQSPDGALHLNSTESQDMQSMIVDLAKLNPDTKRIVFVLTINEAFQKRQNFSMISDAYIRIMDIMRNVELVSFPITEYNSTITSMMVGEIYLHNGNWKFNAIGNGVARDLAGLCEFYGIETL